MRSVPNSLLNIKQGGPRELIAVQHNRKTQERRTLKRYREQGALALETMEAIAQAARQDACTRPNESQTIRHAHHFELHNTSSCEHEQLASLVWLCGIVTDRFDWVLFRLGGPLACLPQVRSTDNLRRGSSFFNKLSSSFAMRASYLPDVRIGGSSKVDDVAAARVGAVARVCSWVLLSTC